MVIFSMFRTDFKRISISRRVAIFLAPAGAAPSTVGFTMRPRVCRTSIVVNVEEGVVEDVRDGAEERPVARGRAEINEFGIRFKSAMAGAQRYLTTNRLRDLSIPKHFESPQPVLRHYG